MFGSGTLGSRHKRGTFAIPRFPNDGGTTLFVKETGIAEYFHYLVPISLDVRFTAWELARMTLFVRACLGVAINVSNFSSLPQIAQEGLSRVLAQGSGGAGAVFAFSQSVGIAFDVMYETFVYFYEEESGGGIETITSTQVELVLFA